MSLNYDRYTQIRASRDGAVLTLTMDNPPLNAAAFTLHDELSHIFYDVAQDDCQVVVLTGAGKAFSAGGDLNEMLDNTRDPARQAAMMERAPHIIHSLLALEVPVIARVNGHAMGLGATLALFCDVAFINEDAQIADPHVNIGISAGDGGSLIWPLILGYGRARHYLLTGDALSGREAADMGLVHRALPLDQLDDAVSAYAERLVKGAGVAIRATKKSYNMLLRQHAAALVDAHAGLETLTLSSADHREAIEAFLAKRAPEFKGC